MVNTAVILAAGRGTRLKELGKEIPKGFLQLGEKPIIVESLEKLSARGIERVVIVTGHCAEKYEDLARSWNNEAGISMQAEKKEQSQVMPRSSAKAPLPQIFTVHNERYADSGSLYSLYLAGRVLESLAIHNEGLSNEEEGQVQDRGHSLGHDRGSSAGFLLLESDLVYESRALRVLQDDPRPDLILVSGVTNSGDEVWVQTEGGYLRALSKDRGRLERGEMQARHGKVAGEAKRGPKLEDAQLPKGSRPVDKRAKSRPDSADAGLPQVSSPVESRTKSVHHIESGVPSPEPLQEGSQEEQMEGTQILGELVGISKISMDLYAKLSMVAEGLFQQSLHVEYETGLMETAKQHPIPCLLVPDLLWAEIDDTNHLKRAKGLYAALGRD